ncbi:hypothetical protein BV25DRAFT_1809070 [Artomyces pyxidatus]|uniref:Uncharacterized protein n=1 Tax=Artomyces pyxidatus TaxID=48021 RepID=A0ACB8ST00_9AGAM|nr:hypothetical protein BV25DRAFT_1809070 [Artomyces pyxidatus]
MSLDVSPPAARWMKDTLDRTAFHRTIRVLAARVSAANTAPMLKSEAMRKSIMNIPKLRNVVAEQPGENLVLLRVQREADLLPEATSYLQFHAAALTTYDVKLDYNYWSADEILHAILPENLLVGSPTGFSVTGHLAHLNLNDDYLPFKYIIGQVILDKNKTLRTVVNKLDSIDTKFRFFKMELIAGEPDYVVTHHESDCSFTFDFTHVYWNSRLHTEHNRIVSLFSPTDLVADVFAGVGPFAIPAAKHGCAVFANDLNPESYKYLQINVKDNKVTDLVRSSCEDGRDFIQNVVRSAARDPMPGYSPKPSRAELRELRKKKIAPSTPLSVPPRRRIAHFVMNLPDSAITFLDAFRGILVPSPDAPEDAGLDTLYGVMPFVHCHCFTREAEPGGAERDIRARVAEKLGYELREEDEVSLHHVRSVAPNKDMYCISFRLPRAVAFAQSL